MKEAWFKGETDREKVKRNLEVAYSAFRHLEKVLGARLQYPKVSDYQKAAWPYWRADMDGYNRAIREVLDLIKEED